MQKSVSISRVSSLIYVQATSDDNKAGKKQSSLQVLQVLTGEEMKKNKMLTRIYGISYPKKAQLDEYLTMLEEAKKRDHRKLGKRAWTLYDV